MEEEVTALSRATESGTFMRNSADYRNHTRLYCLNGGHHLQLLPDGTVAGSREQHDRYSILEIKAVSPGVVVIMGLQTKRFLSTSEDGILYSSLSVTDESYFLESIEENHYNTYRSQKYGPNWYVGLKKNGQPKIGSKTNIGHKAVFFLPRQVDQVKDQI